MAANVLLEIGTEELPASFIRHALGSMQSAAEQLLGQVRLDSGDAKVETLGTPRRLTLRITDLPERQPDRRETVLGPPWRVAFDDEGKPTRAALGFAKKNGVEATALVKAETDKGEYVSAEVFEAGQETATVLGDLLLKVCERTSFPKSMRWGLGDVSFGRPIHWLVALLDDAVIDFEFAGVASGRSTRGHRFLAPEPFDVASVDAYEAALDAAHVVVDLAGRKSRMHAALIAAAQGLGGELIEDDFLLDECVSLVEEPFVVPGGFDEAYLALPEEVVVSVMRDHQRYFAVRDPKTGALMACYLNVVNTARDPETIAKGNDRVLRARLEDARFFVVEDEKNTLESRVPRLDQVVFQAKLGSVGDKVSRIAAVAEHLAGRVEGVDAAVAKRAATLCKADLETLIVFEFPELQGLMGRYYAQREGVDGAIADAIAGHYKPAGADDGVPDAALTAIVAVADRVDTLVGCFGIGQIPTGSADPFALRRATIGITRIALEGPLDVHLGDLIRAAYDGYAEGVLGDRGEVIAKLDEFFRGRLRAFYKGRMSGDLVEACLAAWNSGSIRDLDARVNAVAAFKEMDEYESLAIAFKRAFNITKDSARGEVDASLLAAGVEKGLADTFARVQADITERAAAGQYEEALAILANDLRAPIDRYFDDVLVMVDDLALRDNRLRLLGAIADTVTSIAHFHLLST